MEDKKTCIFQAALLERQETIRLFSKQIPASCPRNNLQHDPRLTLSPPIPEQDSSKSDRCYKLFLKRHR